MFSIMTQFGLYGDYAKPAGFGLVRVTQAELFSDNLLGRMGCPPGIDSSELAQKLLETDAQFVRGRITEVDIPSVLSKLETIPVLDAFQISSARSILEKKDKGMVALEPARGISFTLNNLVHTLFRPRVLIKSLPVIGKRIEQRLINGDPQAWVNQPAREEVANLVAQIESLKLEIARLERSLNAEAEVSESTERVIELINHINRVGMLLGKEKLVKVVLERFIDIGCDSLHFDRGIIFMRTNAEDGSEVLKAVSWSGKNREKIEGIEQFLGGELSIPLDERQIPKFKGFLFGRLKQFFPNPFTPEERLTPAQKIARNFASNLLKIGQQMQIREDNLNPEEITELRANPALKKQFDRFNRTAVSQGWEVEVQTETDGNLTACLVKDVFVERQNVRLRFGRVKIADAARFQRLPNLVKYECLGNLIGQVQTSDQSGRRKKAPAFNAEVFSQLQVSANDKTCALLQTEEQQMYWSLIWNPVKSIIVRTLVEERGFHVSDILRPEYFVEPGLAAMWGTKAFITVPLRNIRGEVVGVGVFDREVSGGAIGERDLKIANRFANIIENIFMKIEADKSFIQLLVALCNAVEAKDPYTRGHIDRVGKMSAAIAEELKLKPEQVLKVEYFAPLHDIGKIGVPGSVLRKQTGLTDDEFREIQKHPEDGYKILKIVDAIDEESRSMIYQHQERYDGRGYPNKLALDQITLMARIVMVADTYDAMASDRPYRKRLPFMERVRELIRCAGTQFDPQAVEALLKAFANGKALVDEVLTEEDRQQLNSAIASFQMIKEAGIFESTERFVGTFKTDEHGCRIFEPNRRYMPAIPQELIHYILVLGYSPQVAERKISELGRAIFGLKRFVDYFPLDEAARRQMLATAEDDLEYLKRCARFIRDESRLCRGGIKAIVDIVLNASDAIQMESMFKALESGHRDLFKLDYIKSAISRFVEDTSLAQLQGFVRYFEQLYVLRDEAKKEEILSQAAANLFASKDSYLSIRGQSPNYRGSIKTAVDIVLAAGSEEELKNVLRALAAGATFGIGDPKNIADAFDELKVIDFKIKTKQN